MKFQIEPARPEDAEALLAYLKQIGGESDNLTFGAEGLPLTAEQERAHLQSVLDSEDDTQLIVKQGGAIIADASMQRFRRRMSHRAEIGISVAKDYWGMGIGSALMAALLSFAKERGIRQLNLEVRSDNERAIRLYQKFGFQKLVTFPAFFRIDGRDVDFDLMNLDLTTRKEREHAASLL